MAQAQGSYSDTLVMLPESYPVARLLCEYVFNGNGTGEGAVDLLILKKQAPGFSALINSYPFRAVYELEEEYYGRVTARATRDFVKSRMLKPYDRAYFPTNTFRANAFLFGGVLAREVKSVTSSLYSAGTTPPASVFSLAGASRNGASVPWDGFMAEVEGARDFIAGRLAEEASSIVSSGERPSLGIMEGFAHDIELFCNYALGATHARGKKVLDIGGGLGFGSYLLSRVAEEVTYVDKSPEAVEIIRKLWAPAAKNLKPVCEDIDRLDTSEPYDVVYLCEVLEHVKDPLRVLKRVASFIGPEGLLVVTTPEEDLFPYRVAPQARWGEAEDRLLSEAIWPWHIQPLGERALLPMLKSAGYEVVDKSYVTYLKGRELKDRLAGAVAQKDSAGVIGCLNAVTEWKIKDFGVTKERDPHFSAFFYNVTARKVS